MALSEGNATANAQANEEEVGDDDDDNHYYDVSDESSFYGEYSKFDFKRAGRVQLPKPPN